MGDRMGLIDTIKRVASFAEQKEAPIKAYNGIHFRKGEVYASNGTVSACAPIDLKLNCSVSAPKLLKLLRAVGGEAEFMLDAKGRELVVTAGKAKARLELMDADYVPKLERPPEGAVWQPTTALSSVSRLGWCTDRGDRMHLAGIQLSRNGMAATNGSALVRLRGTDFAQLLGAAEALVPPKSLAGLPEPCWVAGGPNRTPEGQLTRLFVADDAEGRSFRVCSLIADQFPPVDTIVGSISNEPSAKVMREPFTDLVKRVRLGSDMFVLEAAGGRLSIATDDQRPASLFSFCDSVPLEDKEEGFYEGKIGIDPSYLLSALEGCESDQVTVRATSSLNPLVIEDGEFLAVIMPCRL
jgi:hypothetical protein